MKDKNPLVSLPAEIKAMILNHLDMKSLTFFGVSNKQNFHEVMSILSQALTKHYYPSNVGLVASCRGSSFLYFNNACYACGANTPSYAKEFADIQTSPHKLPGNIVQVATGLEHTLILTTEGLYAFGGNTSGKLGLGDIRSRRENFEEVKNKPENIAEISLGYFHTLIRTMDGKLYACGNNKEGQFGLGNVIYNELVQVPIPSSSPVIQIAAGKNHNLVLDQERKVYFCGELNPKNNNTWVELKNIKGRVIKLFAGESYGIIWTNEGVYGYGGNFGEGRELVFSSDTQVKQIAVGGQRILLLTQNGRLYNYNAKNHQLSEFAYLEGIKQIAIGSTYSLAITKSGLYVCGANNLGQLGLGDTTERNTWTLVEKLQPQVKEIFNFDKYISKLKMMDESFQKIPNRETNMEIEDQMTYNYY